MSTAVIIFALMFFGFFIYTLWSNLDWYKKCIKVNDEWYKECVNLNRMWNADVEKLREKIDELERRIKKLDDES